MAPVDIVISLINEKISNEVGQDRYGEGWRDGLKELKDQLEGFKKLFS